MSVSEVLERESEQHWLRDVRALANGFLKGEAHGDPHLLKESADLEDVLGALEQFAGRLGQ